MESSAFEKASGISLAAFQRETGRAVMRGESGLLIAPTGSGKTIALALPFFLSARRRKKSRGSLRLLWITPLRALSKDTFLALERIGAQTGFAGVVGIRTGDTPASKKTKQLEQLPEVLVTTPESLHLLLSYPGSSERFSGVELAVVDEWHELYGSKRGIQVELALSCLRALSPGMTTWGLSATIPNMKEALEALVPGKIRKRIITAEDSKDIALVPLFPDSIERFPWAGHMGLSLLPRVLERIHAHRSVLIFTNTRSHTERWFHALLEADPELAGVLAIHHGSLDPKERSWVEKALHDGRLRVVVCTSSLDLGVDFSPVDAVVQVGSPKDAGRIIQRAGRSGHAPGRKSILYFVPTNSLEILEFEALRRAVSRRIMGAREPLPKPLDVLTQYLTTLACGDGFEPDKILSDIRATAAYADISDDEWNWIIDLLLRGGETLKGYDEYRKAILQDGRILIGSPEKAKRHRMTIGTILSDPSVVVKYQRGKTIGTVEESFISKLKPGDIFSLGGHTVEYLRLKEYVLTVRRAPAKELAIPRWLGGRLSLSSEYAAVLREVIDDAKHDPQSVCGGILAPLLEVQARWSHIPSADELLIEKARSKDGFHLFVFPFEGRAVHEGLGMVLAERLSRTSPMTFSIAANDYGIELLSHKPIPVEAAVNTGLFSPEDIEEDCVAAMNASEIARRKFREIARISGLTFTGFPGRRKAEKQVMASAQLIFDVFERYDPDNLLVGQAYEEGLSVQLQSSRIERLLQSIRAKKLVITAPDRFTPFAFPLVVDRLREKVTSERLEQRIQRMLEENARELEAGR